MAKNLIILLQWTMIFTGNFLPKEIIEKKCYCLKIVGSNRWHWPAYYFLFVSFHKTWTTSRYGLNVTPCYTDYSHTTTSCITLHNDLIQALFQRDDTQCTHTYNLIVLPEKNP